MLVLTDEQASETVAVEICGIMTHPPRVYVEWVRSTIRREDARQHHHFTQANMRRITAYHEAAEETEALFQQMERLFPSPLPM